MSAGHARRPFLKEGVRPSPSASTPSTGTRTALDPESPGQTSTCATRQSRSTKTRDARPNRRPKGSRSSQPAIIFTARPLGPAVSPSR